MHAPGTRELWIRQRVEGWGQPLGRAVSAGTWFLALSGLSIFFLPFSVFNQHAVVLHTLVGVLYVVPFGVYMARHVRAYWSFPLTHVKLSGYLALAMALPCIVSGVVLTWEGLFSTRITYAWRAVHIVTTFGLVLFLAVHLVPLWLRSRRAQDAVAPELRGAISGHAWTNAFSLGAFSLGLASLCALVPPVAMVDEFPPGYELEPYPGATPFSPSLATTDTGGALDARSFAGSETCGTSGCHEQIYQEWLPSAHRYASMDVGFQAIQSVMAQQNGADSTRYCGGCHDPISLFSGTKNIGVEDLTGLDGYQEGISCLACHAISETDIAGNANYVIDRAEAYVWERRDGPLAKFLNDFLIRTYPDHHVASLSRRMFKTPEFCAACHKQFIDETVNEVGWVQLQNQFDNWRASRWFDEKKPERTIECRECHMPLVDSYDPAAGDAADLTRAPDDGKHRSHRFLGGNQFIPELMELEGHEEHVALTHAWLRGEIDIEEIAHKWSDGPAVPIELRVPESVHEGEPLEVVVRMVNNKVGHDFPTGPLDIIQAWVEIEARDASGRVLFHSGKRDQEQFIEPGTFMFKAEPVDRHGNLIDRHNLWEMVGVRFKRSLFPGSEDLASFAFECSGATPETSIAELLGEEERFDVAAGLEGPITVEASLNYRKFDQYLLDYAFGEDAGITSPITVLSTATAQVRLEPAR